MSTKPKLPEGAVIVNLVTFCPVHGRNTTTALCESEAEYRLLQTAVREGFPEGLVLKNATFPKGLQALTLLRKTV